MAILEEKLKKASFWLKLCAINQSIALAIITLAFVYSIFTGDAESMKVVLSIYAVTLLTPQIAMEVILLIGLFMVSDSFSELRENVPILLLFLITAALLAAFVYLR